MSDNFEQKLSIQVTYGDVTSNSSVLLFTSSLSHSEKKKLRDSSWSLCFLLYVRLFKLFYLGLCVCMCIVGVWVYVCLAVSLCVCMSECNMCVYGGGCWLPRRDYEISWSGITIGLWTAQYGCWEGNWGLQRRTVKSL